MSAKIFLLKTTSACGIAEIVKTFRIKGMHVVEMNAVEEEFRINIFEIAGFMATVIPLTESLLQLLDLRRP